MGALVGIDVGGTKVALCVGAPGGELQATLRRATEPSGDPAADVARLAEDARQVIAQAGLQLADVEAVGVSLPGPLDPEGRRVLNPPNLPGWGEVPVGDLLSESLGLEAIHLENDANAAAVAEARFGAGRGFASVLYATMSTGVGGGIVLDGRLWRGRSWSAGEIGHTTLEWDGELCNCGLRGCAEAYIGGAAWQKRLARVAPDDGRVAELAGGSAQATPVHVVEAAREGDAFALAEIERFNRYLTHLLVNLAFTLDPEAVVLGTIVAAAGEELVLGPVREAVRARTWPRIGGGLELRAATLGEQLPYYAGLCAALTGAEGSASTPA